MAEPTIVPHSGHTISRQQIDSDALKILSRLKRFNHTAYLVGGSVRDLLLDRRPKDFDISTSAHPYQIKRLFRNCWIIGRRFRLAHIKFGPKTLEVATFRRQATQVAESSVKTLRAPNNKSEEFNSGLKRTLTVEHATSGRTERTKQPIQRDNTFGTAREDAFRRDFTVNALFYDTTTLSIIDYVGGLKDLNLRLIRCIGKPAERFIEDPVRMLRAVALAARLEFEIDPPIYDAIRNHGVTIRDASPARLLEELYKILRSGAAERTFRHLAELDLLKSISRELHENKSDTLWHSLAKLDRYRAKFRTAPNTLTNSILLGNLLVPIQPAGQDPVQAIKRSYSKREAPCLLGTMLLPRRDVQCLQRIIGIQQRLLDPGPVHRTSQALTQRDIYQEALTWLEIHGGSPTTVQRWRSFEKRTASTSTRKNTTPHQRRSRRKRRKSKTLQK